MACFSYTTASSRGDQDILILVLNASLIVRAVLAFATTFMAKRQSNRIKVFASATG